jgi:hypothetical protein
MSCGIDPARQNYATGALVADLAPPAPAQR